MVITSKGGKIVLNIPSRKLCDYIEGVFLKEVHNNSVNSVTIYSSFANNNSVYFAINSSKYSSTDGGLGFTCNEDSVFGLGGVQNGHDEINIAIENGSHTVVIDDVSTPIVEGEINYILVPDTLEALAKLTRKLIDHYDAKIVAVTGSLGKSSSTNVIFQLINTKYKAKKSYRIRSTFLGLIIDIIQNIEDEIVFVLEYQSDGLGQIEKFCDIAKPDIAVITAVREAHLTKFKSKDNILHEKLSVFRNLKSNGFLVINKDDPCLSNWYAQQQQDNRIITVGTTSDCDYQAKNISDYGEYCLCKFMLSSKKSPNFTGDIYLNTPGKHSIYPALFSLAIANIFEIDIFEAQIVFTKVESIVSRLQGFKGINGSLILLDSYNGNFDAACSGITYLIELKKRRKILILGSLLELSHETERLHRELGRFISASYQIDSIILMGEATLYTYDELRKSNHFSEEQITHSFSYEKIVEKLSSLNLDDDTVVYIKGSGTMRMELIAPYCLSEKAFG